MKILFIGNRIFVLKELLKLDYKLTIYAKENSLLEKYLVDKNIIFYSFNDQNKNEIIELVKKEDYDFLISNGCPFVLPTTKKIMINIHPTYLPYLRGKTPLNGILYNKMDFWGATMHYISSKIDGGNIIYQERHSVTPDLDLGLLYFLSFSLEGIVFRKGWDLLLKSNFIFLGNVNDVSNGSYFNRTKDKMRVDFSTMSTDDLLRVINSFGIESQGVNVNGLKNNSIKTIYEATKITNDYLLKLYLDKKPGETILHYDSKYLVKTIDGILKITKYKS